MISEGSGALPHAAENFAREGSWHSESLLMICGWML